MALYSIFQEAFTASTSACDVGQEMLHATLLLSCALMGWCASSALLSASGWFHRGWCHKAKEGSSIFCEEVAAYVQANTIKDATKHFGLSQDEIRNCIDAAEQSQTEAVQWKVGQIRQWLHEAIIGKEIKDESPLEAVEADCEPVEGCEDACAFSIAPAIAPGMALLEQYGVFGAASGTWSGPETASPIPRHQLSDIAPPLSLQRLKEHYSEGETEDKTQIDELANQVEDAYSTSFASSHGYGMPASQLHNSSGQYCHNVQGRVWVPLEYTW